MSSEEPRRFLALAGAAPVLVAAAAGSGRWVPGSVELLALACLCAWTVLAQRRLRTAPPPPTHELVLAASGAALTGLAAVGGGLGGFGATEAPPLADLLRFPVRAAALGAAACFTGLALAPTLRRFVAWVWDVPPPGEVSLAPRWTLGAWAVIAVGCLLHAMVFFAHAGPLVQMDSWANVLGPPLFHHSETPPHYTPIYAELVKVANAHSDPALGLGLLVLLQHVLVLGMGVAIERTVRLAAGNPLAGVCAGSIVVVSGDLAIYAQEVMSEALGIAWTVLATASLFAAARCPTPQRWLVGAGLASAAATLTRQAMQGWFVALAVAVLLLGFPHRKRALTLFLLGALLPLGAVIAHNAVFYARPSLTASVGRNLYYRVTRGLPDLTDPQAAPTDPYERARTLVWRHRDGGWDDAYTAIHEELGWEDPQIEQAMKRFYVEQVLRHPAAFTRVTFGFCGDLLRARVSAANLLRFHNQVLPEIPRWDLPRAEPEGWTGRWLHAFQPTASLFALLLALLSPLLVRGPARVLALTALLSVAYFVVLTALVELPLPRYRLPTVPFLAIACGLSLGGLAQRTAAWRKRRLGWGP